MPGYKKILTWFLILLLISQEIVRIPYSLSTVKALEIENHENIVSLIVEETLYKKIPNEIEKYALRIQSVLPHTRTVILTFPESTHPMLIASANERLYYSGLPNHGDRTQKLVGTILIGNIPLPTVHKAAASFLSIFPYIDFDEPNFSWNWKKNIYEYINVERKNLQPELWHSIIAPHTGSIDQDATDIREFFARVYQYDAKQGQYTDVGKDPEVLYVDSVRDSRATSPGSLAAYEKLFVPNQEHFRYNRYTKEFAGYLYESYLTLMKGEGHFSIPSFSAWSPTKSKPITAPITLDNIDEISSHSSSFLSNASDISTRIFARELIPEFAKTFGEKYLGDISRWVHQSGRYYDGYAKVRVDTMPELIQERDLLSSQILKQANDSFEKIINTYIEGAMSVDIPVLVKRPVDGGFMYTNYFFGQKASTITDADQCSLLRGSSFGGKNTTAEMNHGYYLQGAEEDVALVAKDAQAKIKCTNPSISYWGGNSAMNLNFTSGVANLKSHTYDNFSQPIYDPAGGKKATGTSSPFDCLKTDLLLEPYTRTVLFKNYKWPKETGGSRYSCATDFYSKTEHFGLDPSPESTENIFSTLSYCSGSGNTTLLARNGSVAATCVSQGAGGTYKLVSSLIKHDSPDIETYGRQLTSLATPNLPVDEDRYVAYINRNLQEKRFDYPNVFDISVPLDATDEFIKKKIQEYFASFDTALTPGKDVSSMGVFSQLVPKVSMSNTLSLGKIIAASPDLENNLVASIRWRNLPTAMKYQQSLNDTLRSDKSPKVAMFGAANKKYEISYLGGQGDAKNFIIGYHPGSNAEYPEWYQSISDTQHDYTDTQQSPQTPEDPYILSQQDMNGILGNVPADSISTSSSKTEKSQESCDSENAVVIWEWPAAIQCWLKNLFKTKWEPGSSSASFDWSPYLDITFGNRTLYSTERTLSVSQSDDNANNINDDVENQATTFSLKNIPSDFTLIPHNTIRLETYLEQGTAIVQDNTSNIDLVVLRIANLDTGKTFIPSDPDWGAVKKQYLTIDGSSTLGNGRAVWTIRSLTNARISYELQTRIGNGEKIYVKSDILTLLPESKFPKFSLISSTGSQTPKTIKADDPQGINILFQTEEAPSKVDIEITDFITNKTVLSLRAVPVIQKNLRIGSPTADAVLHTAGKYIITLTNAGLSAKTELFVTAGSPKKLVSTIPNVVLVKERYIANFSVTDTWGNIVNTDNWITTIHTSRNILSSGNNTPTQDFTFPLSGQFQFQPLEENNITFDITAKHGQESIQHSLTISALDNIHVETTILPTGVIKVGQKLPVTFTIKTKTGTVISGWDTPLHIDAKGTMAHLENNLVTFTHGIGSATLVTGTQSGMVSLYLSDTLSEKRVGTDIEIAPEIPNHLTFSGPEILLARRGKSQPLSINIFDKYGNYIHPSNVDVRIEMDRADLLEPLGKVINLGSDTYGVNLMSNGYPGRVLLRGALWENGKKSILPSLENVWEVQILPVISAEDVAQNTWNSLTHVLLGGPFGQFMTSGYFAGSLLFSPNTRALSISTLVDNPRAGLLSISSTGVVNILGMPHLGAGLAAVWQPDARGIFSLLISDKRLGPVAKIVYPHLADKDSIIFSPSTKDTTVENTTILHKGVPIATVKNIFDVPFLAFSLIPSVSDIQFNVLFENTIIGTVKLSYSPRIPSTVGVSPGTFSVITLMSDLVIDNTWGSVSSADIRGVMVSESATTPSYMGGPVENGYSAYPEKFGMGWTEGNIGLLQFAAGSTWSQSQQQFSDFVTVNLGDALLQLPDYKVDPTTGFDATIGVPVFTGSEPITDFNFSDINNDKQKDIIVTDDTKTLLVALAKKDGTYLDMGEFLSFDNARNGTIRTGDFFGDGYADVVYVDNGGALRLVSHDAKDSHEIDLVSDRARDIGTINQIEVFDMDHDNYDDIIVSDSLGQLSIFYGTSRKVFAYQFVDHIFDFAFAEKSLFSGSVYYEYPGFTFPDATKTQAAVLRSQQEQLNSLLFTSINVPNIKTSTQPLSIGTQIGQTFMVDANAGDAGALSNISTGFDALSAEYGDSMQLRQQANTSQIFPFLKAPFINPNILSITKKYSSLEKEGTILAGSLMQGVISIKNTSSQPLSKLLIAENFPSFLEQPITEYTLKRGSTSSIRSFINSSDGGIIDLRDTTLAPNETLEIMYSAKFASFSFGTFDVGYLENKNDPLMNIDVTKNMILSINSSVKNLTQIPEKDFYNSDQYGDIRINPNNTCGGPLFLWRSHNTFDRTYQKTLIVRDIKDPDTAALDISNNPLTSDSLGDSSFQEFTSSISPRTSSADLKALASKYAPAAQSELETFNKDTDKDTIPDRYDEDTKDVFTVDTSGNSIQVTLGLGKLDEVLDSAIQGVETFMSGLSCGFGDPGCIATPMNWTFNVPGNTITALGYAVPGINQAPIACYRDVRCGIPLFSVPTASYPYFWPPNPEEGGGAFDIGTGSSVVSQNTTFTGGYGTSQFRLFLGGTLSGAIATVLCFGPNNTSNPIINFPGLFPVAFQGNCIFATQPIMQCSDDGSGDIVTELEISSYEGDTQGTNGDSDIQLTDGDSCQFFTPIKTYSKELITATDIYLRNPTAENLSLLRAQISENAVMLTGTANTDQSLLFTSSSPYSGIQSTSSNNSISYPEVGSGNGMIKITLDGSSLSNNNIKHILDIKMKSISAFPQFIMDWYHRQMDEIVSSLSSLPDIKIFLPDLASGFADGGWIPEFGASPSTNSSSSTPSASSSVAESSQHQGGFGEALDTVAGARDSVVSGIQSGLGGIQSAFEYLSLLPMVHVRPETIALDLPWMDRSTMQSWLYRNEAILAQWEALPQNALGNAVNTGPLISSIRSNIETVRTYMTLPQQLQQLFYLKEKFLYEVLKNVQAIQQLMGGWLYDNGERFKTWVETFILITKLWDLWQVLIDVFDDYEESCAVCHNEQWNLQEWLWITISAVIPPIPVVKMPRWPDIELDFSDIDLGIDIAYPVFNLSFYPLALPDMPSPNFSGLTLDPVPQLPPLPNLNIDFELPMIQLPKLPNLPPAPLIPKLSASISVVLKIFKIVTLIQCLYRKVPLSPEWYVGTKIAHKTDRQGYLPIDFLNVQMPSVSMKWVDAIRVSTHVQLKYDVDFIIEMIRSALEPLANFPGDLSSKSGDIPSTVNFDLDPQNGSHIQTSSLQKLPELIGQLYEQANNPQIAELSTETNTLINMLALNAPEKLSQQPSRMIDTGIYSQRFQEQAQRISNAIQQDIDTNQTFIADLSELSQGKKDLKDIAWLQNMNPNISHLAASTGFSGGSALLDILSTLKSNTMSIVKNSSASTVSDKILPTLLTATTLPLSAQSVPNTAIAQQNATILPTVTTPNSDVLKKSKGLYITKNGTSKRLNYFSEDEQKSTVLHMIDDDMDGDKEIFYILGNTIYRKENHTKSPKQIYIKDSPQIFTLINIMKDFFGQNNVDISLLPHDMQIFLRENHSAEEIDAQYLLHGNPDHRQFDIFSTWGQNDPQKAQYRVDSIAQPQKTSTNGYSIMVQPKISDISGHVSMRRSSVYRILLPNGNYTETSHTLQKLPTDFVIRSQKMAYTKEKTTLQILFGNETENIVLRAGEVLLFTQDSKIVIQSGSLILPDDDVEEHTLTRSDIDTPIFPHDSILTGDNGVASILFSDGTKTQIYPQQIWSIVYHTGTTKVQNFSLPVISGWYYVVSHDARTPYVSSIPEATLFDTHTTLSNGGLADTLPTVLNLNFDKPTEIDFQQYFPLDILTKVEINGLPEAFWKQLTVTKILFQTSQEKQSIVLKVTGGQGVTYTYPIELKTTPAQLAIVNVDSKKILTGTISEDTSLPISIQSFINNRPWTLVSGITSKDKVFTASLADSSPEWSISYNDTKVLGVKRNTGILNLEPTLTVVPDIRVGSPLAIKTLYNKKEIARVIYQIKSPTFQQVATIDLLQPHTLKLISSLLHLEPALLTDTALKDGAYIVDSQYKPVIAFDSEGIIRYLSSDIKFSVQYEGKMIVFTLFRAGNELGKLYLSGDMLTAWEG